MTRVCLVGDEDVNLRYELLSRETAREALATYDLREPFENTVGVETVSLGAAVALLNDLDWYLARFAADALVFDPSVSDEEWLSRGLAAAVRDGGVTAAETERFLKIYGLERAASEADDESGGDADAGASAPGRSTGAGDETTTPDDAQTDDAGPPRLVEPMYVTRTGEDLPAYDLRDVDETLVVRVTESEFGA
jgi:hypothetical protein